MHLLSYSHHVLENTEDGIAFSAYHNNDNVYNTGDIIQFNSVDFNQGGSYQAHNGYFICPLDGIYAVTTHVLTPVNYELNGSIMKESAEISQFESDLSAELRLTGGNFVVTECLSGERLWVRSNTDNVELTAGNGNRLTTFTGFIIQYFSD